MKKLIAFTTLLFLLFAGQGCKDKKKDPPPAPPEPTKYGTINFKITTYDSLGRLEDDNSGVKVTLIEKNVSAVTDANGMASFSDLAYGFHTPVLQKHGYDGPIATVHLNSAAHQASLPFPKHSYYSVSNLALKPFHDSAVYLSFNFDPPLPDNDTCKVVIISSTSPDLTHRKYMTAELAEFSGPKITDYNIALFPEFRNMLLQVDSGIPFYVSAVPVSYGLYESNLQEKPQLLGRPAAYPGNVAAKKNWKD